MNAIINKPITLAKFYDTVINMQKISDNEEDCEKSDKTK